MNLDGEGEALKVCEAALREFPQRRAELIEAVAEADDQLLISYVEGHPISAGELKKAIRRVTLANVITPVLCGSALRNRGVRPMLNAVADYLPSPVDVPPVRGTHPKTGEALTRRAVRRGALRRPGLQDRRRPLRGSARLLPRLLGQGQPGDHGLQQYPRRARAHRPPPADARPAPRGHPGGLRRLHRRRGGPEEHLHGRHPLRPEPPHRSGGDQVPRAGHRRGHRASHQGRPGPHERDPGPPIGGGPHVPHPLRLGDGPDHHLRHGRAPPGDHRRPDAARVSGGGPRGQARGGLQGDHHPRVQGRGAVHPPDRRPRPVRRGHPGGGAPRARARASGS